MEHQAVRVVVDTHSLSVKLWGSGQLARKALPDALVMRTADSDEVAPAFEVATYGGQGPSVVLLGEPSSLSPQILAHEWSARVWLAHGCRLYGLPRDLERCTWVSLDTQIVEVRAVAHLDALITVCEANVVSFDPNLQVRWSLATDLIEDYVWLPDELAIRQVDGPELLIDLRTGSWLQPDQT